MEEAGVPGKKGENPLRKGAGERGVWGGPGRRGGQRKGPGGGRGKGGGEGGGPKKEEGKKREGIGWAWAQKGKRGFLKVFFLLNFDCFFLFNNYFGFKKIKKIWGPF